MSLVTLIHTFSRDIIELRGVSKVNLNGKQKELALLFSCKTHLM